MLDFSIVFCKLNELGVKVVVGLVSVFYPQTPAVKVATLF
jgi:hypothetical protein